MSSERFRVGIVGASGYGGGEALRLCARHPHLEITAVYGHGSVGGRIDERYPALAALAPAVGRLRVEPFDPSRLEADVLIASLPTGQSVEPLAAVPEDVRIIDIGGDHRFADGWTYGLADIWPERVRQSRRVANPGCYPSAAILALAPLFAAGLVEEGPVIIDAKSGVSGAGRGGGGGDFGYSETNESVHAYKAMSHAHEPEIRQALRGVAQSHAATGDEGTRGADPRLPSRRGAEGGTGGGAERGVVALERLAFVPHLVPMTRGILTTCYVTSGVNANECVMAARAMYEGRPFVRVVAEAPRTKHATGSNMCFVHYTADPARRLVVATAAIDNLGKGAAGQAVQNLNLMLGLEETAGLEALPLWP